MSNVKEIFTRLKAAPHTVHVKLLGDSITHGVGGTGFEQNGPHITENFARNPYGHCWAKQFKEYMEAHYNCTVTNNACTGTKIEFVLSHFEELVDPRDDVVICTIGTNNRHRYFKDGPKPDADEMREEFYANVLKLHERFLASGKDYVLIANIPATVQNEKDGVDHWRVLHMNDINDVYKRAAAERGFPFVSLYDTVQEYCRTTDTTLEALLDDGLHPNDRCHDLMFSMLVEAFGV